MVGRIATWTAPITMNFIRAGVDYAWKFANGEIKSKQNLVAATQALFKAAGNIRVRQFDEEKAQNFLMVVGESIIFGK